MAANAMYKKLNLGYFLGVTSDNPERNESDGLKPDLILYPSKYPGERDPDGDYSDIENLDAKSEYKAATSWAEAVIIIEVKTNPKYAPFNFGDGGPFVVPLKGEPPHPDSAAPDARDSRAQMISYVAQVYNRQHRCFVLSAFIQEHYVRFMRWDRTGAIVSPSYDWKQDPDSLLMFLWCTAQAERSIQGYDPTVTPMVGDLPDARAFRYLNRDQKNVYVQKYIDEATRDKKKYPWMEVSMRIISPCVSKQS